MFRPQIKVIDCTIRDGGLINNSYFSMKMVKAVYKALCEARVDIVEMGYRNSMKMFSPDKYGIWRFTTDETLKELVDGVEPKTTKLAIMMDAHKSDIDDLKPKDQSPVDVVRIAAYVKDIDKAINISNDAHEKGYQTAINIMAISHAIEWELDEALQQIEEETSVFACYIVDSFGALYSEDIDFYYDKYKKFLKTKELGIHCHNNQQLAFANTIQGIIRGVNYLDGTLYGIGRGAGNCPLELLFSFLKNPKYDIRPLLKVIGEEILPLQKDMEWGYHIPYMISGILNLHPDDSINMLKKAKDSKENNINNYVSFYEKCIDLL